MRQCRSLGLALLFASVATVAAAQQKRQAPLPLPSSAGTAEEEAACKPDVRRFCSELGEDQFRILACLQSQRERISKACLRVLENHGQ